MHSRSGIVGGLVGASILSSGAGCREAPIVPAPDMSVPQLDMAVTPADAAVPRTWTTLTPMSTARVDFAITVDNSKIYTIGGFTGSTVKTVEVYDPTTDTWTRKADAPTARRLAFAATALGRIYVIGGVDGTETVTYLPSVEEYDPTTDHWATKSDLPVFSPDGGGVFNNVEGNMYVAGATLNDKIYVAVFDTNVNPTTTATYQYDPATDSWDTARAPSPLSYDEMVATTLSTGIYVVQRSGHLQGMGPRAIADYDPAQNLWTNVLPPPDAPVKRVLVGAGGAKDKLYVVGGFQWQVFTPDGALGVVQYLDLSTSVWHTEPSLGTPRHSPGVAVVGSDLYVIGGGLTFPPNTVPTGVVERLQLP